MSFVDAGAGNDVIKVWGVAEVDAGAGNDVILVVDPTGESIIRGGTGNDELRVNWSGDYSNQPGVLTLGSGSDAISLTYQGIEVIHVTEFLFPSWMDLDYVEESLDENTVERSGTFSPPQGNNLVVLALDAPELSFGESSDCDPDYGYGYGYGDTSECKNITYTIDGGASGQNRLILAVVETRLPMKAHENPRPSDQFEYFFW